MRRLAALKPAGETAAEPAVAIAPAQVPAIVAEPETSSLGIALVGVGTVLALFAMGVAAFEHRRRTIAA